MSQVQRKNSDIFCVAGSHITTERGGLSVVRFWRGGFGEFPRLVGRYCSYLLPKQTRGTAQILIFKTSRPIGRPALYISSYVQLCWQLHSFCSWFLEPGEHPLLTIKAGFRLPIVPSKYIEVPNCNWMIMPVFIWSLRRSVRRAISCFNVCITLTTTLKSKNKKTIMMLNLCAICWARILF